MAIQSPSVFSVLAQESRTIQAAESKRSRGYLALFFVSLALAFLVFLTVPIALKEDRAERRSLELRLDLLKSEVESNQGEIASLQLKDVSHLKNAWTLADTRTLMSIYAGRHFSASSNNKSAIVVGEKGFVATSDDCGHTWEALESGVDVNLLGIEILPSFGEALIIGRDGTLIKYDEDVDPKLQKLDFPDERDIRDIFRSGRNYYVSGSGGLVKRTQGNFTDWLDISVETEATIYDMDFSEDGKIVAVGEDGLIAIGQIGGSSWRTVSHALGYDLQDVEVIDNETAIVAGRGGAVRLVDIGAAQIIEPIHLSSERIIDIEKSGDYLIISGDGGLLAISGSDDPRFDIVKLSDQNVNLRQITVLGKDAFVPTKFGDVVKLDLESQQAHVQYTPARGNMSRVILKSSLECAFAYGEDGQVVYPSTTFADQLEQVDANVHSQLEEFYTAELPRKIRDQLSFSEIQTKIRLIESAQSHYDVIESKLNELIQEDSSGWGDFYRVFTYAAALPIFALVLLLLDFSKRRMHFHEREAKNLLKTARALELADVSETHDEKVSLLKAVFDYDNSGEEGDVSVKDLLSAISSSRPVD